MKTVTAHWLAASALIAALAAPGMAAAQSTWNLYNGSSGGSGCVQNSANANSFGNSWACTGVGTAGTTLTASAFSTQNASSGSSNYQNTASVSAGSYYANAYMHDWGTSGFGAANRNEGLNPTSPNHAFDNIPAGAWDGALLNFGSTGYVLSSIGLGWTANASGSTAAVDITVLRWTGSGAPTSTSTSTPTTGGKATLAQSGWSLVGSYFGLTGDSSLPFGNTARATGATQASSYWLITAFNSTLNGGTSCTDATGATKTCDEGDDAFKINYVSTTVAQNNNNGGSSVPEPSSLALAGLAIAGLGVARRRRMR